MSEMPTCIIIAGPTGIGKSDFALMLAQKTHGEIVNADSMQVYKDLPILTAIPSPEDQAKVPHHLYGIFDGGERCSVARWLKLANESVADIRQRGKIPILVGGTGLYLKAAIEGISPIPDVPSAVREKASAMLKEMGGAAFRTELAKHDPILAERLKDNDRQRLVRGMEVALATGEALSTLQEAPRQDMLPSPLYPILLTAPRQELYQRINNRFQDMLKADVLKEVSNFAERNLNDDLPLMKALGLKPLMAHLKGDCDKTETIAITAQSMRNFAKRQLTWFRHQYQPQFCFDINDDPESFFTEFLTKIGFRA